MKRPSDMRNGPRLGRYAQAKHLADRLGIPTEDVFARWAQGLRFCGEHGWEAEAEHNRLHMKLTPEMSIRAKQKALSEGRCTSCLCRPAVTKWHCQECRDKRNAASAALRIARKDAGLCSRCGRAPLVCRCRTKQESTT